WSTTASLAIARDTHTASLLPNGKILIAGGYNGSTFLQASAELYDIGLGFLRPDWQPQVATANLDGGGKLVLTGIRFQGISGASGCSTQDSSTNYPTVQLRSLGNDEVAFLPVDSTSGWSDTSFTSTPVTTF